MKFDDILLALVMRKPVSGYDAKRWLDTEGLFLRANADQSQIYRTFRRLLRQGLVEMSNEARPSGPDAKVYSATAAGAQRIRELAWESYEPTARWQEPDFIAKFTMIGLFVPESLGPLLRTELEYRRTQVLRFRNRDRAIPLELTFFDVDPAFAKDLMDASHEIGCDGQDRWIAWLEQQLDRWSVRYEADSVPRRRSARTLTPASARGRAVLGAD